MRWKPQPFVLLAGCTAALVLTGNSQAWAVLDGGGAPPRIRADHFPEDTCRVIKEEASKRGLPEPFFARLIWKELVQPVGRESQGSGRDCSIHPEHRRRTWPG